MLIFSRRSSAKRGNDASNNPRTSVHPPIRDHMSSASQQTRAMTTANLPWESLSPSLAAPGPSDAVDESPSSTVPRRWRVSIARSPESRIAPGSSHTAAPARSVPGASPAASRIDRQLLDPHSKTPAERAGEPSGAARSSVRRLCERRAPTRGSMSWVRLRPAPARSIADSIRSWYASPVVDR